MQGTKALFGKCSSSNPVWCKCKKGIDQQHKYPSSPVESYEDMLTYCEESVGCEIQSFEEMCCVAHYSPGVARGGGFTPFTCPCCGYKPSERKWRADLAAFNSMSDAEQKEVRDRHNETGQPDQPWDKHYYQFLYTPPALHIGMERAGVDQLHLLHLNAFKHLFNYTIHQPLPGE
jgi:hypothetical protein